MSFYEKYCLPHLINAACSLQAVQNVRQEIVPLAEGRVLEVGMGSGLNMPFYNADKVDWVWALEPSEAMRKLARPNIEQAAFEVRCLDVPGESIPLDDNSVDTVLLTFTLCSIADWFTALQQMRRVLKPEGKLIFCEHGLAPETTVQLWQHRLTPFWKKIAGGCHLDRPIAGYLQQAGFHIERMQTGYLPAGPKFAGFVYRGMAQ